MQHSQFFDFICFFILCHFGGVKGDRTPDLLAASQTLSQLSYDPIPGSLVYLFFWALSMGLLRNAYFGHLLCYPRPQALIYYL